MEAVYANLVRRGIKSIDEVPDKLRAQVAALLEGVQDGY